MVKYDSRKDRIVVIIYRCCYNYIPERDKEGNIIGIEFLPESSMFINNRQGNKSLLSSLEKEAGKEARRYVDQGRIAQAWAK
ncbi:MAG: hypothetical protein ABH889_03460 [Candidatus Portnoybacteria bacterium]